MQKNVRNEHGSPQFTTLGSGSTGDDTASEDTISDQGADGKHYSQVIHIPIVHLVGQVITVSIETVQLVNVLAQMVRVEDWLGEAMRGNGVAR